MQFRALLCWFCIAGLCAPSATPAQHDAASAAQQASQRGHWGDQGNGSFLNPVLPGDFSDLDAIRVGHTFYAISSTMQYSPGMAVLTSHDLVNWRIAGHVVSNLSMLDPELGWQRMNRSGRGIWAGSIRYHGGRFQVYFGTPDGGIYRSTARHAQGPWSVPQVVLAGSGWDDPCPFWDDDGRAYLVATRFAADQDGQTYRIHLFSLQPGGASVVNGSDRVIHQSKGSEANKLYKINGVYLHYFSEVRPEGRVAMMERAPSLAGPWEIRQLNHVHGELDKEPNQGGLVQLADGQWWFLTHQGKGDWEGRAGVLLPVTWIDGWPILGKPGPDQIGEMVWGAAKPIASHDTPALFTNDKFDRHTLRPAWEWRYQPRAGMWSLTGHSLRLRAFEPIRGKGFDGVRNVLTQRSARSIAAQVTVRINLDGMADGQQAGLAHFALTSSRLAVVQQAGVRRLVRFDTDGHTDGPALTQATVWLCSTWNIAGQARFAYSLDGTAYTELGAPYQLTWGAYRGDRIGLYTLSQSAPGGSVDFRDFHYQVQR